MGRESGTGVLNVNGGTLTTSGNGNMYIGRRNGTGTLNQTAGTLSVNREFGVGSIDARHPLPLVQGLQDQFLIPQAAIRLWSGVECPNAAAARGLADFPALLAEARALGLKVIPWTVNERPVMERLMDWGVDGIISDYPDRLRAAMAAKGLPPEMMEMAKEKTQEIQQAWEWIREARGIR